MSKFVKKDQKKGGFTLIELLIVIAIIAILAAVVFVALNPLKRFKDSRDSQRTSNVSGILSAIKVNQIDNGGHYLAALASSTPSKVYMIGTATSGCTVDTSKCITPVTEDSCLDLSGLVTQGYLSAIPVSPDDSASSTNWSSAKTGFTVERSDKGFVYVRACNAEDTSEIGASR